MTNNFLQDTSKTQAHHLGFLFWCKWILSFIWPVKLLSEGSNKEYIELVLYRGNRLLNSRNANYSNGNLQEAYTLCFSEIDLKLSTRNTALVLGFGLGGVSRLLYQHNDTIKQVGVENHPTVVTWYRKYCKAIPNVDVRQMDAVKCIYDHQMAYDVIIVDVYNDLDVPDEMHSKQVLIRLSSMLTSNGVLIFNKVVANSTHKEQVNQLMLDLSSVFKSVRVNQQFDLNHFIICQKET